MGIHNQNIPTAARALSRTAKAGARDRDSKPLTFRHTIELYLKDSNAYGNTYFSRYFEWQGICRERWFQRCIAEDMLQSVGILVTKHAEQDFLRETFPFQRINCRLNTYNIRRCSANLLFRFYVGRDLVAIGRQQLLLADHQRRIIPFPKEVMDRVRRYQLPELDR